MAAIVYLFISHSSRDSVFVRQLTEHLGYYGVPCFLDEKDIDVGDSIPSKISGAIQAATHALVVISVNSASSRWVKDELDRFIMKELSGSGCTILPVRIDDAEPPAQIAHRLFADFRGWEMKETYLAGVRQLVRALKLESSYGTSEELRFLSSHLAYLLTIAEYAASSHQLWFQAERLWFQINDHLERESVIKHWYWESSRKTLPVEEFEVARRLLAQEAKRIKTSNLRRLAMLMIAAHRDFRRWSSNRIRSSDDMAYRSILAAERNALTLSAFTRSLLLELQALR